MYKSIEIKSSAIHGRGVFAKELISAGVEMTCEVVVIPKSSEGLLHIYRYPWDRLNNQDSICIGFGSFFNHSNDPNVKVKSIDKFSLTKTFITLKDIQPGDELFINYGSGTKF